MPASHHQAIRRRPCLLQANRFCEWQATAEGKQPWYFSPRDADGGEPVFAFASPFEAWRPPDATTDADWLLNCCIVITAANELTAQIRARMPVIIHPEHWARRLRRDLQVPAALASLMAPADPACMQAWPVSRAVNRSSSEGSESIDALQMPGG